jgi:C4-dicarboxylate-specific signal transduction histidine kinase
MTNRAVAILLVEDSQDDAELIVLELERAGFEVRHRRVETAAAMRDALAGARWDLVMSDYSMPEFDAVTALAVLHETGDDIPFIIVSGTISEDIAIAAMRAGAKDFFTKHRLARLPPVVERELREAVVRRERRAAEHAAEAARRDQERAAREQAALLGSVLDSLADALVVVDRDGRVVHRNRAADAAGLVPRTPVAPDRWAEHFGFYDLDDRPLAPDQVPAARALRGEVVDGLEVVHRPAGAADGVRLSINARPLAGDDGAVHGAVVVHRDVTAERKAQAQLVVSDRMASVGMLAAGVAHEINNPLAALVAFLSVVQREVEDLAAAAPADLAGEIGAIADDLTEVDTAAERVRVIVRDLKLFSRSEGDTETAVEVVPVIESSLRMAWNEIRHRARVVRDFEDAPPVRAGEARLGQVFLNLLVNAAQALPLGRADQHEIRVRVRARDGTVIATVEDTGPGIAPEHMRRLFTPFFTTKPRGMGTGLGLSICQRIVNDLGGEISVDSEVGVGTRFTIALPAARRPTGSVVAQPLQAAPRRARILMVDDDRAILRATERVLGRRHDVTSIDNALEAIDRITAGDRYDVILCDLMMPVTSGMELHRLLAARAPEQADRVVFLTGGAFTAEAHRFLDEVGNERLDKPIDFVALEALISRALDPG